MSPERTTCRCPQCGSNFDSEDGGCPGETCNTFPSFEDWKLDLTSEKLSEFACQFYFDKIGLLNSTLVEANPKHNIQYELAEDAEDFILEDIVAGVRFEDEFYDYLKEQWKEEEGR